MCNIDGKVYLFGGFQPKQNPSPASLSPETLPVVMEEGDDEWEDEPEEDDVTNTQVAMEFEWSSELFEFDGKTWKLLKSGGITPRAAHSMAATKSSEGKVSLYVFGGRGEKERQNDIWRFENGEWAQLKTKGCAPDPCSYSQLVCVGEDRLVAFGGLNQDNKHSDHLHVLDLSTNAWLLPEVCFNDFVVKVEMFLL